MARDRADANTHINLEHIFYLKENQKHHPDVVLPSKKDSIRRAAKKFAKGSGLYSSFKLLFNLMGGG